LGAVAVVALLAWQWDAPGLIDLPRGIEVPHGEQRTVQLRDGSVAHLNSGTQIKVRYSPRRRLIEFEHGQALFQVARDPARAFRVKAGAAEVLAVGTQFELYRKGQGRVTVTVVEGKVEVFSSEPAASGQAWPLRLKAGEQVHLDVGGAVPDISPVDVRIATAWVQREVVFKEKPLGEVAEEFGRYSSVPIVIDDPALRELHVSGIFRAYDVESFVGYLEQLEGIEIERRPDRIRLYRQ
jgi:transmembrane sensor